MVRVRVWVKVRVSGLGLELGLGFWLGLGTSGPFRTSKTCLHRLVLPLFPVPGDCFWQRTIFFVTGQQAVWSEEYTLSNILHLPV